MLLLRYRLLCGDTSRLDKYRQKYVDTSTLLFIRLFIEILFISGCRDLLSLIHNSISVVHRRCLVIRSGSQSLFHFIPNVLDRFEVRVECGNKTVELDGGWVWVCTTFVQMEKKKTFPQNKVDTINIYC